MLDLRHGAAFACASLVLGGAANAQNSASYNQAYVNQVASSTPTRPVSNQATLSQTGSGNRLGTADNQILQNASGGDPNTFSADQAGGGNMIGFWGLARSPMPLVQNGSANTADLRQTGQGNMLGGVSQGSELTIGGGNALVIEQTGDRNQVFEVVQKNNGSAVNTAVIRQTGDYNGLRTGAREGGSPIAAVNGSLALMERSYIGTADAQLLLVVFAANGTASYFGPDDRLGAALYQAGGGNAANLTMQGRDNGFLVQQNSTTAPGGKGNRFDWSATGSSNYAYALQVGTNLASNVVVGSQNAFLVYQGGESGAASNGTGNIATWQQGAGAGDVQNFAEIVQLGMNNTATGLQVGAGNVYRGYQRGSNNDVAVSASGSFNAITSSQQGANNQAVLVQATLPRTVSR